MDDALIEKLLDVIEEVVNAPGTYREKAKEIKAQSNHNLSEFVAWFGGDVDGDDEE